MSEPTNGEVMRRLDDVLGRLDATARAVDDSRRAAEQTYVRKDVYDGASREQTRRIEDIEKENAEKERNAEAFRRQVIVAVLGVALPAFGGLVLAVTAVLNGGTPT